MQNSNDLKEEDKMTMKSADYQYTPKEGFILTHFLTVAEHQAINRLLSSHSRRKSYSQWGTYYHPDCQ